MKTNSDIINTKKNTLRIRDNARPVSKISTLIEKQE